MAEHAHVSAAEVHEVLARHVLTDGFKLVLDLDRSRGSRLIDARTGVSYLDLYTFFASAPLGLNPAGLVDDPAFLAELSMIAANKPANPDMYSSAYAEFVETFARVLGDPELPHLFFIEGGALAVENALKVAFDWKSRQNEAAGRDPGLGTKIMHLSKAFHGRSGYTMSLTNTEPGKVARFPKFDWPRIDVPAIVHPLEDHLEAVTEAEERALSQARKAFQDHPHDIAAFIAEPIQGEGGDNHLRPEFLQAMQQLAHDHDALFIVDEVQTGAGTGTAWAYQQLGLEPDVVAFGKKVQVGGIMAGRRVDEVADNVFHVSGRINSTWGGGLVDMVRSQRLLEIIEAEGLIEAAGPKGERFVAGLRALAAERPGTLANVRGRGLMIAVDLADAGARDALLTDLRDTEHVVALPCGERSIRFRPALSIENEDIDEAVAALGRALGRLGNGTENVQ